MASSSVRVLPILALQPSTGVVISDILKPNSSIAAEDCWVSAYNYGVVPEEEGKPAATSVHGRFRITEGDVEGTVEVASREDKIEVELKTQSEFLVSCPSLSIPPTPVLLPSPSLNTPQRASAYSSTNSSTEESPAAALLMFQVRGGIDAFAFSHDGKRVVVGGRDGQAKVVEVVKYETAGKKLGKGKETALRGHQGDLTAVEWFPSNEVVLTASSDMSLRVFSAVDGFSPRHLLSHTKRVTSLFILRSTSPTGPHKGRQILSSSLDGTLKLWEVATSTVTQTWTLDQPVSTLGVVQEGEEDDEEVLKGKWAIAAHSNGSVSLVDLASPTATPLLLAQTSSTTSLDSIATLSLPSSPHRILVVGGRNGVVSLFLIPSSLSSLPLSSPLTPVAEWRRTEGGTSINSVALSSRPATSAAASTGASGAFSVLVAPSDGLAYRALVTLSKGVGEDVEAEVKVVEEFVGLDIEPATGIKEDDEGRVWVSGGGGDGGLRVYERERA